MDLVCDDTLLISSAYVVHGGVNPSRGLEASAPFSRRRRPRGWRSSAQVLKSNKAHSHRRPDAAGDWSGVAQQRRGDGLVGGASSCCYANSPARSVNVA